MEAGKEIAISIDQTLTQDATGTMAYLEFEAMGMPKVKTKLSVSYVDHNTLQTGFENADDHRFLQTVASKYGIYFSKPGNGICHQVHLERFAKPGQTLLGSDSHTPNAGAMGMLAIGAGGLDVAMAMAGCFSRSQVSKRRERGAWRLRANRGNKTDIHSRDPVRRAMNTRSRNGVCRAG